MQGEIPTLEELDEASGDHPLFLIRICHHAGLVNRPAYQTAGIREGEKIGSRENGDGMKGTVERTGL